MSTTTVYEINALDVAPSDETVMVDLGGSGNQVYMRLSWACAEQLRDALTAGLAGSRTRLVEGELVQS